MRTVASLWLTLVKEVLRTKKSMSKAEARIQDFQKMLQILLLEVGWDQMIIDKKFQRS
jgi:hypothetical protein